MRMTSGIRSPLIATGCQPLCPSSPPEVGKRRLAVPSWCRYTDKVLRSSAVSHSCNSESSEASCSQSEVLPSISCCDERERRGSILSLASTKVNALLPRGLARRTACPPPAVSPTLTSAALGSNAKKGNQTMNQDGYLEPPTWKYKRRK